MYIKKYKNKRGTSHGNNNTQANKGSPLLSEEVPYQRYRFLVGL